MGEFTFLASLDNSEKFIKHHLKLGKFKKIHFVGHSWGGFISLNMLRKFSSVVDKIFLLSPFSQVPENKNLTLLVNALFHDYPHCFLETTKDRVKKDFMSVEKKYDLIKFLQTYTATQRIKILQAENDLAVPESTTRHLSNLLGENCKYQEVKLDHSFTEQREQTIKVICEFFKRGTI